MVKKNFSIASLASVKSSCFISPSPTEKPLRGSWSISVFRPGEGTIGRKITVKCDFSSLDVGQHRPGLCPLRGRDFLFYIQKARCASGPTCRCGVGWGGCARRTTEPLNWGRKPRREIFRGRTKSRKQTETKEKKTDNGEQWVLAWAYYERNEGGGCKLQVICVTSRRI